MLDAKSVCCGQKLILKTKSKCGPSVKKVKKFQEHCCANSKYKCFALNRDKFTNLKTDYQIPIIVLKLVYQ